MMNQLSPDYAILYQSNPYEQDAKELSQSDVDNETDDMLDRLLGNSRRINQLVFDGGTNDFNYPETDTFFELVSKLMVCPAADRVDYIDDLRKLCERKLKGEAKEMAIQYLEARDV
jgi:hypothetical protein